jgi:hypothetical protein
MYQMSFDDVIVNLNIERSRRDHEGKVNES